MVKPMKQGRLSSGQSGVAGEYLCAGELARRGHIATLTLKNSKGVDILASNADASKTVAIQVKTSYGNSTKWVLSHKAEDFYKENLFYVFVNLNFGNPPDYFIVPSKVVADTIKEYYKVWRSTPGRKGQEHNENPMRTFIDKEKQYLGKWDSLGL